MHKKERLKEFNQYNIIDAAEKLFSEKGIVQTTMDDIAKEAQYSKSTIYVYFKSKEEIYSHIVRKSMVMLRNHLKDLLENSNGYEEMFKNICYELVRFQEEYPLYFESISGYIGCENEDFKEQPVLYDVYLLGEEVNQMLVQMVNQGMEESFFKSNLEPLHTVLIMWASICGIIRMAVQKQAYLEERTNCSKQHFLEYGFTMLLQSIRRDR